MSGNRQLAAPSGGLAFTEIEPIGAFVLRQPYSLAEAGVRLARGAGRPRCGSIIKIHVDRLRRIGPRCIEPGFQPDRATAETAEQAQSQNLCQVCTDHRGRAVLTRNAGLKGPLFPWARPRVVGNYYLTQNGFWGLSLSEK